MIRILVTGFEPFGGETVNPSWEAVQQLSGQAADAEITRVLVPTTYAGSIETVMEAQERCRPQAIVMVGQAGGRTGLSLERIGVNLDEADAPDNAGVAHRGVPIEAAGPAAYFATLPLSELVQCLQGAGIPAGISNSAGLFVCNHLLYGVLHRLSAAGLPVRAGFVHVPFLPEQVAGKQGIPSMALNVMVRGLDLVIQELARVLQEER